MDLGVQGEKSLNFAIPSIRNLPVRCVVYTGFGYICGKIAKSSTAQWMAVAAITTLARDLIFIYLDKPVYNDTQRFHRYATVSVPKAIFEILALRKLNLISTTGTVVLAVFNLVNISLVWPRVPHLPRP